jgi:hypothetical protein
MDRPPSADRPEIPYGIMPPAEGAGLIPWSRAVDRLRNAYVYWICTVDTSGRPHAIPVWGVWLDDALYFSNGSTTRTGRALAANPNVSVHLESGEDVVILEGTVEPITDGALEDRLNAAYAPKYLWEERVEGWYRVRAEKAFAWLCPSVGLGADSLYRGSATRWTF